MKFNKAKTLYIIGNGFDLHHRLDTWYSSFGLFLRDKYGEIYENLLKYIGFGDLDENDEESLKDPLWSHFEASLAGLDAEYLLENYVQYAPNYGSDDFRDRDRYDMPIYLEQVVEKVTLDLRNAFEEFIINLEYPDKDAFESLRFDEDSIFLSFNYTDTLERFYDISRRYILYIHNKAGENESLVLGHGINPKEFEETDNAPPKGTEEYEQWLEYKDRNYDYSIELGKDEIRNYFKKSFKPTSLVLKNNETFFNQLGQIRKVFILGHSLAEVDMVYFKLLAKKLKKCEKWIVSYFKEDEKFQRIEILKQIGIEESKIVLSTISGLNNI